MIREIGRNQVRRGCFRAAPYGSRQIHHQKRWQSREIVLGCGGVLEEESEGRIEEVGGRKVVVKEVVRKF